MKHPGLRRLGKGLLALVALAAALILPFELTAGVGGPALPWNTPLQNLLDNLTGDTARILAALMLAICGVVWGFSGSEEGAWRFGQGVCAIAIMFGAVQIVSALAFAGGVM